MQMKIAETYSHLNGLEFLLVHKPSLWDEITKVIKLIDANKCKNKVSKEKTKKGEMLFSPIDMNNAFKERLSKLNCITLKGISMAKRVAS